MKQKRNTIRVLLATFVLLCVTVVTLESSRVNAVVSTNYHQVSPRVSGVVVSGDTRAEIQNPNSVSGDGRYVVFSSEANNIIPDDTNNVRDIFVRDTQNSVTTRISITPNGSQADSYSRTASISYDGHYVVFSSNASNLVSGVPDTTKEHVYVRNLINNTTSIVDTAANGDLNSGQSSYPTVSAEGRFVAFQSISNNLVSGVNTPGRHQIYVKDMYNGAVKVLSKSASGSIGNDNSYQPSISCDGNMVAFATNASNLGSTPEPNSRLDLALVQMGWTSDKLDMITSSTQWGMNGGPQISCDGSVVLYVSSGAANATPVSTVSGYTNAYQYNRLTGANIQVSLGNGDAQADSPQQGLGISAAMSADGRYVAFTSRATNVDTSYPIVDPSSSSSVYIRDVKNSTTELASILPSGNRSPWVPNKSGLSMSANGSVVAFTHTTPSMNTPWRALITGVTTGQPTLSWPDIYSTQTGH